jgi:hypothetical protein
MSNKLEGEGSYEGTRRYNEGVKKKIEKGEVGAAAEEAKRAVEGPEGHELEKAEKDAKSGPAKVREPDSRAVERADGEGMAPKK